MRCNFRIDQSVAFEGEFGHLDVHNCYDLVKIELLPVERRVRLSFEGTEHTRADQASRFALELNEVSHFESQLGGSDPDDLEVDEISFREPGDRDYDVSGNFDGVPGPGEHLVFRLFEGHIRIAAASADIVITRSNVISFPGKTP